MSWEKSVTFKEGKGGGGGFELIHHGDTLGPKQTFVQIQHLNLPNLNLSVVFLTKKKRDFGWDMTNASTYPAFELT